jgi:ATP adenylyltransferase
MWSPWRSVYIASFKEGGKRRTRQRGSLFTRAWGSSDDKQNHVVWRGKHCFVIMNRYPYNSGHLMVVPVRQVADLRDLRPAELAEIMRTVQRSLDALETVMGPHGYNFGANLGRVSGAGIDDHIHFHIVPRWNGDTNFMPVLGETKVISEELAGTAEKLRKAFRSPKKPK